MLQDEKRKKEDEEGEAFHFVAYVPRGGVLWELDGLREGPIPLCEATDGDWLDKVRFLFMCFVLCFPSPCCGPRARGLRDPENARFFCSFPSGACHSLSLTL